MDFPCPRQMQFRLLGADAVLRPARVPAGWALSLVQRGRVSSTLCNMAMVPPARPAASALAVGPGMDTLQKSPQRTKQVPDVTSLLPGQVSLGSPPRNLPRGCNGDRAAKLGYQQQQDPSEGTPNTVMSLCTHIHHVPLEAITPSRAGDGQDWVWGQIHVTKPWQGS